MLLGFTTCLGTRDYPLRLAMSISALAGGLTRTEPWSGGSTPQLRYHANSEVTRWVRIGLKNTGGDNTALLTRSPHFSSCSTDVLKRGCGHVKCLT